MRGSAIGPAIIQWARREPSVAALVLIGSRARASTSNLDSADEFSDWDFQVIASRPGIFDSRDWLRTAGLGEPLAYAVRLGRLGTATKISVVLRGGEIDLVVLPLRRLRSARLLLKLGLAKRLTALQHAMSGLATVLRDGYSIVVGEAQWGEFLNRVAVEFKPLRLSDSAIQTLAEGFVCDYVSTRHKIERGELLAAQRWIHLQLAEVNFQLFHELRQRRGEPTLPDARRVERLARDSQGIAVNTVPTPDGLRAATEKSAAAFRELMGTLVPDWHWPDLD